MTKMTIDDIKRFRGEIKVSVVAMEHEEVYVKVSKASLLRAMGADVPFEQDGRHDATAVNACLGSDPNTLIVG